MTIFDSLILGILQGITEFLPVSSSGHLVLVESFMNLPVSDLLVFDVAVHFGTLLAIFVYFRKDFIALIKAFWGFRLVNWVKVIRGGSSKKWTENEKMIGYLIAGTIPAVIVGLLFGDAIEENFRNPIMVAFVMALTALFFLFAEYVSWDKKENKPKDAKKFGIMQVLVIGIAQAAALTPGVSRSGCTISAGLTQGLARSEAARFSFLLGAVAISAATMLSLYKVMYGQLFFPGTGVLVIGVVSAFVSGYASVSLLMLFLKKHTLLIFSVYLVILAGGIIAMQV